MEYNMDNKMITTILLIAASVLLIAWDIYVAVAPPKGDTISEIVLHIATHHPIIPFAIGVICGHLFWSQHLK